tara:strand:- start:663 stop:971 length:309 start_codon:yes stop_codon:yes gene_type:complete
MQIAFGVISVLGMGWMGWLSLLALRNQKSIIKNQGNVTKLELQVSNLLMLHKGCKQERMGEINKIYDRVEEHSRENAQSHNAICTALGKVDGKMDILINGKS